MQVAIALPLSHCHKQQSKEAIICKMKIDYFLASQGYLIDINLPFDAAASGEVSLVLQSVLGESQFVGSSKNSARIQPVPV